MSSFHFRDFSVRQSNSGLKVGTDAMVFGAVINSDGKSKGLDIGTGTGVLSLMVAQKNSKIQIQAIDVQKGAIEDAAFNFQNCSYSNRLKEIHEDFLAFDPNQKFDLIFTNPPFYADAKLGSSDQLNQAKHILEMTPKALFQKVKSALEETGSFWIIWPFQASSEIITVASKYGLYPQVCMVINGKPAIPTRIILEFGFQREEIIEREITIRTHSGDYSDEYKNLTKDFHNKTL